jgi:F-type H+-transporting ATPase subunit gamma
MKMIASTKMTKAQRLMVTARVYGQSAGSIMQHVEVEKPTKPVFIAVSSDRGLCKCLFSLSLASILVYIYINLSSFTFLGQNLTFLTGGGIHSAIAKNIKRSLKLAPESYVVTIGQKAKVQIIRDYKDNVIASFEGVAKVSARVLISAISNLARGVVDRRRHVEARTEV